MELRRYNEQSPMDEPLRECWVREVRAFADRAQALADRWEEIHPPPKRALSGDSKHHHESLETPTPVP